MTGVPPEASDCLAALAQSLGLSSLQPDGNGLLALSVGNRVVVHIQANTDASMFVLFGVAGVLPVPLAPQQLVELLQANRFWRETGGATLSLDDDDPLRVILAQRFRWHANAPQAFCELFGNFAGQLAYWSDRVASAGAAKPGGGIPPPVAGHGFYA